MGLIVATLLVIPLGFAIGFVSRATAGPGPVEPNINLDAAQRQVHREIWYGGREVAKAMGWDPVLFPQYLIATAWTESNFRPRAMNKEGGPNAARGVFQLRPRSAFHPSEFGDWSQVDPSRLYDVAESIALQAWYASRATNYTDPENITYARLRRYSALPKLVKPENDQDPRAKQSEGRWATALQKMNIRPNLGDQNAFDPMPRWIGYDEAIRAARRGVRKA